MQVIDRPGTDEDKAVFRLGPEGRERLTLGRRDGQWVPKGRVDPACRGGAPEAILERDGAECVWCRRPFEPVTLEPSLEHVVPRLEGRPGVAENEVAACRPHNRARGHVAPSAWLDECERDGRQPRRDVIAARLLELRDAIAERGGQRRARPYLDGQLRRLGLAGT